MIKVGEHAAYIVRSTGDSHKDVGIIYIPDVIGIWANSQLLADEFAESVFTTIIIDIFRGDAIPMNRFADTNLADWIANGHVGAGGHTTKDIDPIIKEDLAYMRSVLKMQRIGAVGYCFGGKYVVRHLQGGIDVGFIAHPSFVDEDELKKVTRPLSIAAAETDSIFPSEKRYQSEMILRNNGGVYQITLYSGVVHEKSRPLIRLQVSSIHG
jgi:dienelactone hydrolase